MNLTTFLMNRAGQEIPKIRVISVLGTLGTVEVVTWDQDLDDENSWVSIKWDNGNYTDHTISALGQIKATGLTR